MHCDFHHAHLFAADLDASIRFYREMFGAEVVFDKVVAGARNVLLRLGAGHINFYDQPPRASRRGGIHHLGIRTDELAALVALRDRSRAMTDPADRVDPVPAPYPPELQAVFDQMMPPGVPPLRLFATLARVPRVWDRLRAGSLLDRGPLSLRQREIVIDRTCARCGCEYEWGVHAAFFAERARLTPQQLWATVHGAADDAVWAPDEQLLIRLVDELHDTAGISDDLWRRLSAASRPIRSSS